MAPSALRMVAFWHDLAQKHAFDLIAQADDWCGGTQPGPHDSGTSDAYLGRPFAAAIYVICSVIDWVRLKLFDAMKVGVLCEKVASFVGGKMEFVLNRLGA